MNKTQLVWARNSAIPLLPGLLFCLVVVFAAQYISEHYGSPLILTTVLLGMAFNNLSRVEDMRPGLDFCVKSLLRLGVALLGIRISFEQIAGLGYHPIILVIAVVCGTIMCSLIIGKWLGVHRLMALLTGIAVAICGVSAAMALLAILPRAKLADNQVACTLMSVTCLSTLTMILYPALMLKIGFNDQQMGLFLGTTIHDVAQAVGAGEMISAQVAEITIYTKMLRVALLVPVLFVISFLFTSYGAGHSSMSRRVPTFLIGFVVILTANNLQWIPANVAHSMNSLSQFLLLLAMAALGTKTNFLDLVSIDRKPLALVLINTVIIAAISLAVIFIR